MSLQRRVSELERVVANLVRVGLVSSADAKAGTVRVTFDDDDDGDGDAPVTHDLPVLYPRTRGARDYWLPQPEEQVVCVFLPYAGEQGFVVGAHYSEDQPPPTGDAAQRRIEGGDVRVIGADGATVQAPTVALDSGDVRLGGESPADTAALGSKTDANFTALKNIFSSWAPAPNDGGAALKAALAGWAPESVAAAKVRAE